MKNAGKGELMNCPECGQELEYSDYYGPMKKDNYWTPSYIERVGDIYHCQNEECEGHHFHTDSNEELHEGYPC